MAYVVGRIVHDTAIVPHGYVTGAPAPAHLEACLFDMLAEKIEEIREKILEQELKKREQGD